ncbi:MAG TPA: Gfo/Idh/MocA family oxidoreductase [Chryseolinea sp.]|nr:Gfo/Idh/MocA family oxidoreductase [Chryseolinea sp.]
MNPINTALLSYGMSGEIFHAPLLDAHKGFNLSVVLERKRAKASARYPHIKTAKDIDSILNDKAIELVVVNTPNETHFDFTSRVLEAGKHAVVEKPFSVTTLEANNLIALAKKNGKTLTVFQNRRFDGDFLTVKKIVDSKLLGTIVEFELHYDRFRNYIELNTWKEVSAPGTGILYNLGSHMLDQVLVLFGMPDEADARIGIQRPGGEVDDFYDIRLHYPGFHVIVKSSYLVREPGPRYVIHGTEGSFVKYGLDPQEQALKDGVAPGSQGWGIDPKEYWGKLNTNIDGLHCEARIETLNGNYLLFYDNVYAAMREGAALAVQSEQSRDVITLIELCEESNRKRASVRVRRK